MAIDDTVNNEYDKRFSCTDITKLQEANIPPELANEYIGFNWLGRFNWFNISYFCSENIIMFIKNDIPYKLAKKYTWKFSSATAAALILAGISLKDAKKYDKRFSDEAIRYFVTNKIMPKDVNIFHKRFKREDIYYLTRVSPGLANKYNKIFTGRAIGKFARADISPELAEKYDKRFVGSFGLEIVMLAKGKVPPEIANRYNPRYDGSCIAVLYNLGICPDLVEKHIDLAEQIVSMTHTILTGQGIIENTENFSFIGVGKQGVIIRNGQEAWKFSKDKENEALLLLRLKRKYVHPDNIIKDMSDKNDLSICHTGYLKLNYVPGETIETLVKDQHNLSYDKAIKYGAGIINGLIEMREAGIFYHRDIRPGNIIIDEKRDEPVIVDLGIATTDRHALPKDNRRFGGPNDLVSVGQIMYYMATGKHIFAQSQSMSLTLQADDIKDYREQVYADQGGQLLEKHLRQVDETIQDERFGTLIKECLTAKKYHYRKMQRMFEEYAKYTNRTTSN